MSSSRIRELLRPIVEDASKTYGVPRELLWRLLQTESAGFNEDVIYGRKLGGSGEHGVAQFMPATASGLMKQWGERFNPDDPYEAIPAAARHLSELAKKFETAGGDPWEYAVAGYNAGEGAVQRAIKSSKTVRAKYPDPLGIIPTERERQTGLSGKIQSLGTTSGSTDWKTYLPGSTKSTYLPAVYGQGSESVSIQEQATRNRPPTSKTAGPTGSNPKPNYDSYVEYYGGDTLDARRQYLEDFKLWGDINRRKVADAASYMDLISAELAQDIASRGLSVSAAEKEFGRRLNAFDSGIQAYSTLAKYAVPTQGGYLYGMGPGGINSKIGLPPLPSSGIKFNPFREAMSILNQTPNLMSIGTPDTSRLREARDMYISSLRKAQEEEDLALQFNPGGGNSDSMSTRNSSNQYSPLSGR